MKLIDTTQKHFYINQDFYPGADIQKLAMSGRKIRRRQI